MRETAEWTPSEGERVTCWYWGDWSITLIGGGYYLLVSSGISYGPFATWNEVTQHAENVRGD